MAGNPKPSPSHPSLAVELAGTFPPLTSPLENPDTACEDIWFALDVQDRGLDDSVHNGSQLSRPVSELSDGTSVASAFRGAHLIAQESRSNSGMVKQLVVLGAIAAFGLGSLAGCSDSTDTSGGAAGSSGGASGTAGAAAGGTAGVAGSSGAAGNAGASSGGMPGAGGARIPAGTSGLGGTAGSGGTPNSGGTPGSGGTPSSGGTSGIGGTPSSGGTSGIGGTPGSGGVPGSGGATSSGGAPGSGGGPSAAMSFFVSSVGSGVRAVTTVGSVGPTSTARIWPRRSAQGPRHGAPI